jgi:hypothetical protein
MRAVALIAVAITSALPATFADYGADGAPLDVADGTVLLPADIVSATRID